MRISPGEIWKKSLGKIPIEAPVVIRKNIREILIKLLDKSYEEHLMEFMKRFLVRNSGRNPGKSFTGISEETPGSIPGGTLYGIPKML